MKWYSETLHPDWQQRFPMTREIYRQKTGLQELLIFETPRFGRVLALDGAVQTTEGDEFIYHEMLVHVPMFSHGAARDVLIIGGGDGGTLREVMRHGDASATVVEIDRSVIDLCREYMPSLSDSAFDNPRAEVVIADGCAYMKQVDRAFDVIIIDSTDPVGPGEVLFTEAFYGDCKARLKPGGILVNQSGVPFIQPEGLRDAAARLRAHFAVATFFLAPVPAYIGGFMAFGYARDGEPSAPPSADALQARFADAGLATRYYTSGVHAAAFALPRYIADLIGTPAH